MKECVYCKQPLQDHYKVCPYCGKKVLPPQHRYCTNCGFQLSGNYKFCPGCGVAVGQSDANFRSVSEIRSEPASSSEFAYEMRVAYCIGGSTDPTAQTVEGELSISQDGLRFKDLIGGVQDHSFALNRIQSTRLTDRLSNGPKSYYLVLTLDNDQEICYCYTYFQYATMIKADKKLKQAKH